MDYMSFRTEVHLFLLYLSFVTMHAFLSLLDVNYSYFIILVVPFFMLKCMLSFLHNAINIFLVLLQCHPAYVTMHAFLSSLDCYGK